MRLILTYKAKLVIILIIIKMQIFCYRFVLASKVICESIDTRLLEHLYQDVSQNEMIYLQYSEIQKLKEQISEMKKESEDLPLQIEDEEKWYSVKYWSITT